MILTLTTALNIRPLLSPRYNKRPCKSGFELQETHFAALRSGIPGVEVLRSVDLLGQEFTPPAGSAEKQYVLDGCDDVETDEVVLWLARHFRRPW